jgi:uncharacterized membrane protein
MMGLKKSYNNIIFYSIFLIILMMMFFPSISAKDYYADITIEVDSSGFVTIDGITNHPDLLIENSEIYTSKKQSYWLLNITKDDVFSDFIYDLTLPEGSSINYIKSSGFIGIEENKGNLFVRGFGENESFSVLIQYQIAKLTENQIFELDFIFFSFIVFIIILIIILVYIIINEKPKIEKTKPNDNNFKGLNQRQKEIMNLLINKNTPLTQTEIQRKLNIPKAAVSRNIRGLELKGLIEKEQIGMSNLIRIKKQ